MNITPINNQCTTYLNTRIQKKAVNFKEGSSGMALYKRLEGVLKEAEEATQMKAEAKKIKLTKLKKLFAFTKWRKSDNIPTAKENLKVNYNGWTELHYFCKEGDIQSVKNLLKSHPNLNLNQLTNDGRSYVGIAKYFGRKDIVNFIVSRKNYDPTVANDGGWTDLHHLCAGSGNEDWAKPVKTILRKHKNLDLNCLTKSGLSYMRLASEANNHAIVNLLAGMKNYDPTKVNQDGCTDLHYLLKEYGFAKPVKKILRKHKNININQLTNDECSYVSYAAAKQYESIVNALVKMKNYDPTVKGKGGWTDIHYLCKYGCAKALRTVFERYHDIIDINQLTDDGESYMDIARRHCRKEVMNVLACYI